LPSTLTRTPPRRLAALYHTLSFQLGASSPLQHLAILGVNVIIMKKYKLCDVRTLRRSDWQFSETGNYAQE
jgi:hypothetical protein